MTLLQRALYFIVGAVLSFTLLSILWAWNAYNDFRINHVVQEQFESKLKQPLKTGDLVGIWHGDESWGTTYLINRKPDGTYTEVMNRKHADVAPRPYIVKSKGYWSIWNTQYSYYETETSAPPVDHRPLTFTILDFKPGELEYMADEGDGTTEHKE